MTSTNNDSLHSLGEWLASATAQFAGHSDSPRLDAEILLAAALNKPRSHLFAWPEKPLEGAPLELFREYTQRRADGEPVAHILERREFWSLPLTITPDTLIPRPDTETLVEAALQKCPAQAGLRILDLGSGSGALALALKSERPLATVIATDASTAALAVARRNAGDLGLEMDFREGRWWQAIGDEMFDIVVSNPPYIRENDPHLERGDVRFEPRSALAAGPDGLDDIRAIAAGAPSHLLPGGWLLLEHGYDQAAAVRDILSASGLAGIEQFRDAGGNTRVTAGRRPT